MSGTTTACGGQSGADGGGGTVLYCHCAFARIVDPEVKRDVLARLEADGGRLEAVPDLCEMSAHKDPELSRLAREPGLSVVACYPRAVRWLFHSGGSDLPQDTPIRNMRTETPEEIGAQLGLCEPATGPAAESATALRSASDAGPSPLAQRLEAASAAHRTGASEQWTPWFPVIDFSRCTNCMQCLSFCLFDVYGVDSAGQIEVRNEDKCKTNCPACSRVCPDVAILFPKYSKGPINGDVVRAEDVNAESMKVDISALLGGDIYSSLKQRSEGARKRFSTERDESKALLERKRCLKELKESLDIPNEVLMSLPSAGEIEERAQRARAKAEKRRAVSQSIKDAGGPGRPSEKEWGI